MSERLTRRLAIRGRVQGVWFRESMRLEAQRLGVTGWVRNRLDGSVEAVVHGSHGAVDAIIAWARRGPEAAEVQSIEVLEAEGAFEAFEKRPTGQD
jgi:acylphosphatase